MKIFSMLLTTLFIGLKLTNYIDWSWVLVFLPIIIYYILGFSVLFLLFMFSLFIPEAKFKIKKTIKNNDDSYYK